MPNPILRSLPSMYRRRSSYKEKRLTCASLWCVFLLLLGLFQLIDIFPIKRQYECGVVAALSFLGKRERAALDGHDLARQRETNARASSFGGVERDEDVAAHFGWDRSAIVADVELGIVPVKGDGLCACFGGILDDIDKHLVH